MNCKTTSALIALVFAAAAHAGPESDPHVFDWRFYLNANPDLTSSGISTPDAALSHWVSKGIYEGRQAHPAFSSKQYLDLYPDLKTAFGANYAQAVTHYVSRGILENRVGFYQSSSSSNPSANYIAKYGRVTISNVANGGGANSVYVSLSARQAGAVDSIYWNGKELLNSWDHGRSAQYAWQYGTSYFAPYNFVGAYPGETSTQYGECFNPTEAGSISDGLTWGSRSILNSYSTSSNIAQTSNNPAYWDDVSSLEYKKNCVTVPKGARYNADSSGDNISKVVTVSPQGYPNLIRFSAVISHANTEDKNTDIRLEMPTIYPAGDLNQMYSYDPVSQALTLLPTSADATKPPEFCNTPTGRIFWPVLQGCEQSLPVIASTPDQRYAIGMLMVVPESAYLADYGFYYVGNMATQAQNVTSTTKIGAHLARHYDGAPTSAVTYVAVGSLSQVKSALNNAYLLAKAGAAPTCSTVNLTPSSLTAAGGSATAQAVCSGTGLSYAWTVNGVALSGSGATNSVPVGANTGPASKTFSVCVTASNASGKSPQVCAPLVQAPPAATVPPACSPVTLTPNSLPAAGGRVSAQANCSGSGLSYKWSVNSAAVAGSLPTNSISVNPNTTTSAMFYAVCVVASNAAGQSSNCGQLVVAATANIAPNCSSVSLTPSSLPAAGGNALGQANCTHSGDGLYYTWTLNGMPYPAAGPASITYVPTNPLPIAANPTASPRTYKLCVVANDSKGQSQLACSTPLTQAGAAVVLPSAPTLGVPVVVGSGAISVPFTPGNLGTGSLVTYTASCGGRFATGMGSPIVVSSGLSSGEPYFCQVKTTSTAGSSPWSDWSSSPVYP